MVQIYYLGFYPVSSQYIRQTGNSDGLGFRRSNVFSNSTANWLSCLDWICKYLEKTTFCGSVEIKQKDAMKLNHEPESTLFCTDPPYYDNIAYADISDYFYVIMKSNLQKEYPEILSTILTPKNDELVATPYLHESKKDAESSFLME